LGDLLYKILFDSMRKDVGKPPNLGDLLVADHDGLVPPGPGRRAASGTPTRLERNTVKRARWLPGSTIVRTRAAASMISRRR
jgi:hypothetical protein